MDRFSFLNAAHTEFFAQLYDQYLENPDSVEPSWRSFFQGFDFGMTTYNEEQAVNQVVTATVQASGDSCSVSNAQVSEKLQKEFKVIKLIEGYRTRGHLFTKTNPVRDRRVYSPSLDIENFDLQAADLDIVFDAAKVIGVAPCTLRKIIGHLEKIYCQHIGIEYVYIRKPEVVEWIRQKIRVNDNQPNFSADEKKVILNKLNQAVSFENFLHTKYVGQKRFSLEGGESIIPALDTLIEKAAEKGVEQFVMGMAHRGRLNVLANIFGKSTQDIFGEFDGKDYDQEYFDGDVKYHLGLTADKVTRSGKKININLAPNPSHLETVGAVIEGITRAKQDKYFADDFSKVLPIAVHGDAAIAGQGILYEIIQMAQLDGYKTGGTIHIVINNQVGFTTNYNDARSSTYCTDVAKVTLSPVLHVNADDAEAVVHAMSFALDFRMEFGRDVFIDLLGYRKYGHNEGDEPRFTQPSLYKSISKHPNPREIYKKKLVEEGVVSDAVMSEMEKEFKNLLDQNFDEAKEIERNTMAIFMEEDWKDYASLGKLQQVLENYNTTYDVEKLRELAVKISTLPADKKFINKISRLFDARVKMVENNALDWAMGELLAYGTLLTEGSTIRISGEDVERGTFSHRHAVVKTEDNEEEYVPLRQVSDNKFDIYNSHLSEYGVLGFDYGYAMASPNTLTIWEAQFGDFVNGAQIVIDQYLVAAEEKWKIQDGLVMLLPHGSEGQGAEHSSGRLERFLTLCANENMTVANVTSPANYFHLLRRQMKWNFRKPLVVMSPKSLLRHPKVVSPLEDFANGNFQPILDDPTADPKKVERVVLCSGKLYFELLAKQEELNCENIALVRLEQLYPLNMEMMSNILDKYSNRKSLVWAQEEPENMGAWSYILRNFRDTGIQVVSPVPSGTPAPGSHKMFEKNQNAVINHVFERDDEPTVRPVTV